MTRPPTALPRLAQRAALTVVTLAARQRARHRNEHLPAQGQPIHRTAVLRLDGVALPELAVNDRHYVYPPGTVHVTVTNLDTATVEVADALARLRSCELPAPEFEVIGLGGSPDTLFLKCLHDERFGRLREVTRRAFGVPEAGLGVTWLFDRLSYANVVRFNGPGQWVDAPVARQRRRCPELEIVRTDRFLSESGTIVEHRLPLV